MPRAQNLSVTVSRRLASALVALVVTVAFPAQSSARVIDGPALTTQTPATRLVDPVPALTGPINKIAVLGDSIYFEELAPVIRVNTVVPTVRTHLRTRLGLPGLAVENRSRPGLAIKYPVRTGPWQFKSFAEALPSIFPDPSTYPDLVVLATSSTDLNIKRDVAVGELVPELVDEMRNLVKKLEFLGMEVVVVPAYAINNDMYDLYRDAASGSGTQIDTNARVTALNTALVESDLPMIFERFRGLDRDGDGEPDAANYVAYGPPYPDDGVHPNATGEAFLAHNIIDALLPILSAAR